MMKKLISVILCLLLLAGLPCAVFAENDTVGEARSLAGGIVAFRMNRDGAADVQDWLDGALTENAGVSAEWWVIALRQAGAGGDYGSYAAALDRYLTENRIPGAVARQRYALALAALGWTDHPFVADALGSTVGEQGIVSWLYGLHFTANGLSCGYEPEELIGTLLDLRLPDGGWAIQGETSDVDVTAMVVQALAPYRSGTSDAADGVDEAVEAALGLLSGRQLADGGYESYGKENAESAAQVILALTALGIDPETDGRFVKDASVVDALLSFREDGGGFRHTADGEENETATVQAYCAAVALLRLREGRGSFFALDGEKTALPPPVYTSGGSGTGGEPSGGAAGTEDGQSGADMSGGASGEAPVSGGGKIFGAVPVWVGWGLGILVLAAAGVLALQRKNRWAIAAGVLAAALLLLTLLGRTGGADAPSAPAGTAVITIRCDTVAGEKGLPKDGCILPETEYEFAEGETVCGLLLRAAKEYRIPVENRSTGGTAYIAGIYSLYEFDFGGGSGWIYRVNGETPSVGSDSCPLRDGDRVEWLYTRDMGGDLD